MNEKVSLIITIISITIPFIIFGYGVYTLLVVSVKEKSEEFLSIFKKYHKTIGEKVEGKTIYSADDFLTIEALFQAYGFKLTHLNALSSALVGVGILGTFVGLSYALLGVDFSFADQETAMTTINNLIDGMKTAFWSSAAGMGLSLIYGWIYRRRTHIIENELFDYAQNFDKEYLISELQFLAEQNHLMAELGKKIADNVNEQSNLLLELGTNIDQSINKQNNTLTEIGSKISQSLIEQNSLLAEMGASIGISVGQQLVSELQASMENLITGVSKSIHDNMMEASEHLKQSAEMLDHSTENLSAASKKIDSLTETLPVAVDSMSNVIGDVQELLESVNESTTELSAKHEAIVETLGDIGDSAIQLNEVIDTVNKAIAHMNEVIRNINIPGILDAQKEQYTQVENLVNAQHKQISSLTNQQLDILNNIEDLRNCIEKLYDSVGAVTNIKKDVKDIFEAINAGLQDHVNLLHNQTTGLLTTYTDKFTSATESINNTVGNLTESFDSAANTMFVSVSESAKKIEEATAALAKYK